VSTRTTRVVYDLVARDRATRTFGRVGGAANGLARTGATVGAALKTGFAVGAVAAGGLGFATLKASGDFEKAMNQVRAVTNASGKDFTDLRDQAKELGATTKFSATQAAEGMGFLAMAGFQTKDIMDAMPGVLSLASAGNMDLGRSADIASNILTGYGFKAKETARVVDVMAKTFTSTNTDLEQLGEAFKYAGPVAKSAGLDFEETSAALGLMGNAGIQASMAGTALRGTVTRLLAPTKKIQTTLDDLGVTVTDSTGKLLPLNEIVKQLEKSGATTGDMMTIFGQRAGPAMLALVDQGSGALVDLTKKLEGAGGTADRIAKIQMEGLQGQLVSLKSAWEGLMIEIGDLGVLNLATGAVEGVTTATRGLAGFVEHHGLPAIETFREKFTDFVPVEKIKRGFSDAKEAVGDFFAGLAPSKGPVLPSPMLKAPQAPASIALPAPQKSDAQAWGETIRQAFQGGIENLDWGKLGSSLGKGLSSAIGWVGKNAANLGRKIIEVFSKIDWVDVGKQAGKAAIPFVIGFVINLFEPLFSAAFWSKHWKDVLLAIAFAIPVGRLFGALAKVFSKIPFLKIFSPLFSGIGKLGGFIEKGLGRFVLKPLGKFGKAIWDGIVKGFTTVFPSTAGKLGEFLGKLALNILGYAGRFAAAGQRLITGLGNGILRIGGGIGEWIGKIIGWLVKPFAQAGSWLLKRGGQVVGGLKTGAVNAAKGIGSWAWRTIVQPLVSRFVSAGSWLVARGRSLVTGLKNGAVAIARSIGSWAVRTIVTPVTSRFTSAGSWLVSRGRSLVTGLKNGVIAIARTIGSWTRSRVISPVTGAFKNAGTWLKSAGGSLISGLKNGVVGAVRGIGAWAKSHIVDPVVNAVKKFFGIRSPSTVFAGIGGFLVKGLVKGMGVSGGAIAKKVFGDMPSALAGIVGKGLVSITSLPGKALKALGGVAGKIGGFFSDLFGGGGGGSVGTGVSRWAPVVNTVLGMLGAPASALGPVLKRIEMESGGNPSAINDWDINARRGDPSRGLMQTIGGTFNAYAGPFRGRGIYDPLANIYAGVNYAMHTYGRNWVNVMTRPGGYDSGGVATGVGFLPKYTPKPERVLSPRQTASFDRLVALLERGGMGAGGSEVRVFIGDREIRDIVRVETKPIVNDAVDRAAFRQKVGYR